MCGASGGHTHPLIGNALNVTYGGVTHLTHGVVALLTWHLGHLNICGCRRDVGANVSMCGRVASLGVRVQCVRRLHVVEEVRTLRRGRRGWPLLDLLVTVLLLEAHMMWHLVARLHDRREFPMLGHLP